MVAFQHDGTGIITYSFLGSTLPGYVRLIDLGTDGTPDLADLFNLGYAGDFDDFLGIELNSDGSVPNLSFTATQQAGIISAINAWNEVANIRMQPGGSEAFSGGSTGTEVTGTGSLVSGLGGDAGFGEMVLSRNDDGNSPVDISPVFDTGLNFFGGNYTSIFVNTNGSISFESGIGTFTPQTITGGTTPLIAPFWADIDTRVDSDPDTPDSGPIYVDINEAAGIVTITWAGVGYYSQNADKTNSFQLQLYDRGSGDFDIVFRYADINWTTGDASDGEDGLGGTPARMGYSAGNATDFFELPAAGNQSAVLGLEGATGNTGVQGLWEFEVRNGGVFGDIVFGQADLLIQGRFSDALLDFEGAPFSQAGFSGTSSSDPEVFGIDGDVYFSTPDGDGLSFVPGTEDYAAALRAVGQALGLGQDGFPSFGSVLEPDTRAPFWITPGLDDISAIQEIYGPNWETRAEDTTYFGPGGVYELDQNGRYDETGELALAGIWDGGGTDLFDLSHFAVRISGGLAPRELNYAGVTGGGLIAFAHIPDFVYTTPELEGLGISPSNGIENARLGSGDDLFGGNDWENILEGGQGNDALGGRGGDDILHGGYLAENRGEGGGADGNDTLIGHDGVDTAVFDDPNAYTLILSPDAILMQHRSAGGTGTDELREIELLTFESGQSDLLTGDTFNLARFDGAARISATDLTNITELYIAYFNRAPDALGLMFWADAFADDGLSLEQVAAGFIDQPETRALYPAGAGNGAFVDAVYQNVLGRAADAGGRAFWLDQLDSGLTGRDTFILRILEGAKAAPPPDATQEFIDLQTVDQLYLASKTSIGSYYSLHRGMSDVENANTAMQLFTRDALDLDPAIAAIDGFAAAAESDTSGDFLIQVQGILANPFDG